MNKLAKWICNPIDSEDNKVVSVFRREFQVKQGLVGAKLHITSHGVYDVTLNAKSITDHKFTPGFTSYYHRIQIQEYDVISQLHVGNNSWLTTVGDGWWRWNNNFGYRLALWGQLTLSYADGSIEMVYTDESFEVGEGPIQKSDLQKGEVYDARITLGNWKRVEVETEQTDADLIDNQSVPVREKEHFPAKLFRDTSGNLVADFGQNISGYVRMVLYNTQPGQVIRIKHGEALDLEGNFSTANCDAGMKEFQEITYICKGGEREEYAPSFSYFGFRYALIQGIETGEFTAVAVYSDMAQTGDFHCSNPLINKLVENARWSQKGNFLDVPVDCPTRERNAWTGDAQIYIRTAAYFMNVEQFFKKWLVDQRIEQYSSGKVGITFPSTSSVHNPIELVRVQSTRPDMALAGPLGNGHIGEDSVGWGDSAVWLPYQLYLMYGDKKILEDHYETAKKWLEFSISCMKERNPKYEDKEWYKKGDGDYIYDTRFHYGEWNEPLPPEPAVIELFKNGGKPEDFVKHMAKYGQPEVATAYTKRSCDNMAHIAEILNKLDDVARYKELSEKIKKAYNNYLVADNGEILKGHQAPYIRALALDMVDERKKPYVIKQLKQELENSNYHLNTGFLSTVYLLPVLCDNGLIEEAYKILEQTDSPGWLQPITVGATTIPENWDGFTNFRDSLNHYSFGAVCQFFFEYIAGIRPIFEAPGFIEFELKPIPGGSLRWAEGSYQTKYGKINSKWKIENNVFLYECTIPENTIGHLTLPDGIYHRLEEGIYKFKTIMS
ncbi:TPA: family 78 glycoside hydrolase catalytic domain [Streptococcus suis]|nr:family 78 glycoside hydrolase catalytic domain [Streptococcus suis]